MSDSVHEALSNLTLVIAEKQKVKIAELQAQLAHAEGELKIQDEANDILTRNVKELEAMLEDKS